MRRFGEAPRNGWDSMFDECNFMFDKDLDRDTDFTVCFFSSIGGGISSNGFVGIVYD